MCLPYFPAYPHVDNNTFVQIIGFNDIPPPTTGHASIINVDAAGARVYIFGGFSEGNLTNRLYDFFYGTCLDAYESFQPVLDREIWTLHTPAFNIEARRDPSAASYLGMARGHVLPFTRVGDLYLFGGRFANQSLTNEFWRYNCSSNSLFGPFPPFTWTRVVSSAHPPKLPSCLLYNSRGSWTTCWTQVIRVRLNPLHIPRGDGPRR